MTHEELAESIVHYLSCTSTGENNRHIAGVLAALEAETLERAAQRLDNHAEQFRKSTDTRLVHSATTYRQAATIVRALKTETKG